MRDDLEETITKAGAAARDLLGQLGPVAWALHEAHVSAVSRAILLAAEPAASVRIGVRDVGGRTRTEVVADPKSLRRGVSPEYGPRLFSSAGIRDAINRSIIVYGVALLEQFIDVAGKPVWKRCRLDRTGNWPPDTLDKIALLDELKQHSPELSCSEHYVGVGWLVLVRNAIVHADGKAGAKTRDDAKEHRLGPRWAYRSGSLVWGRRGQSATDGQRMERGAVLYLYRPLHTTPTV